MPSMTDQPLRVIEVTATWPAEVFIQRHVQALIPFEPDIHLVARSGNPAYSQRASIQEPIDTLPVTVMPNFNRLSRAGKLREVIRYGLSVQSSRKSLKVRERVLLSFFQSLSPDLIHFHNAQLAASMHWIPEYLGIPYTVSLRGADTQEIPLRSKEIRQATHHALIQASGIHAVCDQLGRASLPPDLSFYTIYTPIKLPERLTPYPPPDHGVYQLLSIGRMHWRKGYPDLLLALRNAIDSGLNTQLTIVGGGPDEERVSFWIDKLQLQSSVCTITKASFPQIVELLGSSHAYIQASLAEGLSNAMAEAMAWGCPVFATNVGGTAEVIKNGQTGFLLEPAAPQRWMERLEQVRDTTLMVKIRKNAHKIAEQTFSPQLHGEAFLDFYRQALAKGQVQKTNPNPSGFRESPSQYSENLVDHIDILVWGPWRWSLGTDQVLRALGRILILKPARIIFVGFGTQEDELRYLANLFKLDTIEFVKLTMDAIQNTGTKKRWFSRSCFTIELEDDPKPVWKVSIDGNKKTFSVSDMFALIQTLEQVTSV